MKENYVCGTSSMNGGDEKYTLNVSEHLEGRSHLYLRVGEWMLLKLAVKKRCEGVNCI
jgi:hypothetical protein